MIEKLLELVFLEDDFVVSIADVVGELGVNLEDHGSLVGHRCKREVFGRLDNEVGVVVANG